MTDMKSLLRSVRSYRLQVNAELERPPVPGLGVRAPG
jgi:hypothetical protein